MVCQQLAAFARPRRSGGAGICRADIALLPYSELRGALARRRSWRTDCDDCNRNPEGRFFDLYRRLILLSDGVRRARHHPDLSFVDVYIMDGGPARRGRRRRFAELADRRAGRHDTVGRRSARLQPVVDRIFGSGAAPRSVQIDAGPRRRARRRDDGHRRAYEASYRGGLRRSYTGGLLGVILGSRDRDFARPLRGASPAARWPLDGTGGRSRGNGRWRRRWIASSRRRVQPWASRSPLYSPKRSNPIPRRRGRWRSAEAVAEEMTSK